MLALIVAGCNKTTGQDQAVHKPSIPDGMALIPAGTYTIGTDSAYPEEAPIRKVTLSEFYIDKNEVTCAEFAKFVQATGYVTVAEKQPSSEDYPDALPELLKPGSAVFVPGKSDIGEECWTYQVGQNWKSGDPNQPVVHIAFQDALAYAKWAGKDLPTEEEWEAAAGADGKLYPWGNEETPNGTWMANTWQGDFPRSDSGEDGFTQPAPVRSFPPNKFGLYDMAGNVWEWTKSPGEDSGWGPTKIIKGGSYLCARKVCHRYRPTAKQSVTPDTGTSHIGFRCVIRP